MAAHVASSMLPTVDRQEKITIIMELQYTTMIYNDTPDGLRMHLF